MEKSVIGLFVMRSRGEQFISNFYLISKNRLGNGKCQHRKDGLLKKPVFYFANYSLTILTIACFNTVATFTRRTVTSVCVNFNNYFHFLNSVLNILFHRLCILLSFLFIKRSCYTHSFVKCYFIFVKIFTYQCNPTHFFTSIFHIVI